MCIRHGAKLKLCHSEGCTSTSTNYPKKEEFVLGMEQSSIYAVPKDAQTKLRKEEYVGGTEQSAMHKIHLLRLDQNSR